ncbi:TIGR03085 family protein [Corynebacterium sp. sy017]|uniref:TIGR03085 family metal-binding protein n=1 Tax=unclassified Corynebacterium TaxID=2624378 RepID=UPI00118524F5|nr:MULTISPECIES: TIGR03085 family metal-binding protein [unclassified Corynebacterium]MBP3087812.1 TIGR03085 family protein [Corynebacterium sp. sy017]TSD92357.1 TIGR03085 family protein [Corynebacterium sp. SY003]
MNLAKTQRKRLADLLSEAGPQAPTLCEGWTTHDLLVHLYVRENYPLAALGIVNKRFAKHLARRTQQVEQEDFTQLLEKWRSGSTRLLYRVCDPIMNGAEHFVHAEDVRRGDWAHGQELSTMPVLELSESEQQQLWRLVSFFAAKMIPNPGIPVILLPTNMPRIIVHDKREVAVNGSRVVRISGDIAEVFLWLYGRKAVQVRIEDPTGHFG